MEFSEAWLVQMRCLPSCSRRYWQRRPSPSTVRSARKNGLIGQIAERGMLVGGVGPATRRAIEDAGLVPSIVPDGTDPVSLARATHRYFARLALARLGASPR